MSWWYTCHSFKKIDMKLLFFSSFFGKVLLVTSNSPSLFLVLFKYWNRDSFTIIILILKMFMILWKPPDVFTIMTLAMKAGKQFQFQVIQLAGAIPWLCCRNWTQKCTYITYKMYFYLHLERWNAEPCLISWGDNCCQ